MSLAGDIHTTPFKNRDKAISYAQELEANGHDVDARQVEENWFIVYVDGDTCNAEGNRIYSNLTTN